MSTVRLVHIFILAILAVVLYACARLNDFLTPFTDPGANPYRPYITRDLQRMLAPDEYRRVGPNGERPEQQPDCETIFRLVSSPEPRPPDNCYIEPISHRAKVLTALFEWRVTLAFVTMLLGLLVIVLARRCHASINRYVRFAHWTFLAYAFLVTMCTRWWGYG